MHDQPGRAPCWCFMGPNPNQIRRGIAEEAGELGNAQLAHRGFKLYEWIITPQRYARTLQRFAHEKGAGGGGRACEGDHVVTRQSLTSLRGSRSCHGKPCWPGVLCEFGFARRTTEACERAWLLGGGAHRGAGKYGIALAWRNDPRTRCHLCRDRTQLQRWGGDCGRRIRRDRWRQRRLLARAEIRYALLLRYGE